MNVLAAKQHVPTATDTDRSMRVLFVLGTFPTLSQTFILNQAVGLLQRGHEVYFYGLDGPLQKMEAHHPDVERFGIMDRIVYPPRAPEHAIPRMIKAVQLFSGLSTENKWKSLRFLNVFRFGFQALSLRLFFAGVPLLDGDHNYDVIHAQFGVFGLRSVLLRECGVLQGPVITTFRGFDISTYIKKRGKGVYKILFEKGDFFLANCKFFADRVRGLGCPADQLHVHGSGIDLTRFAFRLPEPPQGRPARLSMVGRLVEKKGTEYAIKAVAQLIAEGRAIEFQIAGDGPLKASLQSLIDKSGAASQIKLIGGLKQDQIISLLQNTDIFLAPSVTAADGDQDAPVNTLKEAMAIGVPVVSTQHGGIPELVEDGVTGYLAPERDVDTLTKKIRYLLDTPQDWARLTQAGRLRVEQNYDRDALNDELLRLYKSLSQEQARKTTMITDRLAVAS